MRHGVFPVTAGCPDTVTVGNIDGIPVGGASSGGGAVGGVSGGGGAAPRVLPATGGLPLSLVALSTLALLGATGLLVLRRAYHR